MSMCYFCDKHAPRTVEYNGKLVSVCSTHYLVHEILGYKNEKCRDESEERRTFRLNTPVHYVVEERNVNRTEVQYAWTFETKQEAEDMLLEQIQENGYNRTYTAFLYIG